MRSLFLALGAVCCIAAAFASAAPLERPGAVLSEAQPVRFDIGAGSSAMTYWTRTPQGWEVVTTVDTVRDRDGQAPRHDYVEFSATLLDGQTQTISLPAEVDVQHRIPQIRITRVNDRVEVTKLPRSQG